MKILSVLIAVSAIPTLLVGMALLVGRVYDAGVIGWTDAAGFLLQVLFLVLSIGAAFLLWRHSDSTEKR